MTIDRNQELKLKTNASFFALAKVLVFFNVDNKLKLLQSSNSTCQILKSYCYKSHKIVLPLMSWIYFSFEKTYNINSIEFGIEYQSLWTAEWKS